MRSAAPLALFCLTLALAPSQRASAQVRGGSHSRAAASLKALADSDFNVAALADTTDSANVLRVLGAPLRRGKHKHPFDVGAWFAEWHYRGLTVDIEPYYGRVHGFLLTGPEKRTARGLRVGDATSRVRELYGKATSRDKYGWDYDGPGEQGDLHLMRVNFSRNKVSRIYIGWIVD